MGASIDIIPKLAISQRNKDWFRLLAKAKKDDIADAMLMALYWAEAKIAKKRKKRAAAPKKNKKRRLI